AHAMIQAAVAFTGGFWASQKFNDLELPRLSRAVDEGATFKLYVRIIAASIPGLTSEGFMTRERPRITAALGETRKETEFGDCEYGDCAHDESGSGIPPCPWRFGETLTFAVNAADVLAGQGVQLWVRTHS
ncbi:unnamed protein product, partial [Polarella glacialis]